MGKSTFISEINTDNYKVYDLDLYRFTFPNYINLIKDKPVSINKLTSQFAGSFMHKDIVNSLENRDNFILECTFSSYENTLEEIIQKKYSLDITVYLLISSFYEILLSIYERYIKSFNELGYGRIIDITTLKLKYDFFKNYISKIFSYNIDTKLFLRENEEFKNIDLGDISLISNRSADFNHRLQFIEKSINNINNEELQNEFVKVKRYFKDVNN